MEYRKRNPKFQEGYHYLTIVILNRIKIFNIDALAKKAIDVMKFYEKKGDYILLGFVVISEHIHFICDVKKNISDIVRDIKKYIAKSVIEYFKKERCRFPYLIGSSRSPDNSKGSRGSPDPLNKFRMKTPGKKKHIYKIWQDDFYDFNIFSEKKLKEKLEYMYKNPIRKGLCNDILEYRYSDAYRYFGSGDPKLPGWM